MTAEILSKPQSLRDSPLIRGAAPFLPPRRGTCQLSLKSHGDRRQPPVSLKRTCYIRHSESAFPARVRQLSSTWIASIAAPALSLP